MIKIAFWTYANDGSQKGALISDERIKAIAGKLLKKANETLEELGTDVDPEVKKLAEDKASRLRREAQGAVGDHTHLKEKLSAESVVLEGPGVTYGQELAIRSKHTTYPNGAPMLNAEGYYAELAWTALGKSEEWLFAHEPAVGRVIMQEVRDKLDPDPERSDFLFCALALPEMANA